MFAKIVKGKDLAQLESEVNKFLVDHHSGVVREPLPALESMKEIFPDMQTTNVNVKKTLRVYNVQQFVIGEVDPKTVSLINQQPVPTYSFCLLLICGYE